MPLTIADLMSKMPSAFVPEKAQGLDVVLQFKFTGAEPGDWYAQIKEGKVDVQKGDHPNPKMTLTTDSDDYIKLFTGQLDPMQAFMAGKLKLTGDLNLAMKMTQFFRMR
jgi:putative sterol carrier protein